MGGDVADVDRAILDGRKSVPRSTPEGDAIDRRGSWCLVAFSRSAAEGACAEWELGRKHR